MANYNTYSVKILLEKGSSLEERIRRSAQERGISFQAALEEVIKIGLWKHMERNLDFVERVHCSKT